MNFLDRNTLPKFQERLDLAASELNDVEEILCKAINELAGRIYVITNLVPKEERNKFAQETNYLLLDTIDKLQTSVATFEQSLQELYQARQNDLTEMNERYLELEKRLNALDDAAARKDDLNVVLYRTGELE